MSALTPVQQRCGHSASIARLLLSFLLFVVGCCTGADAVLSEARLCFLFFSDVSDLGWTYAFNAARLELIHTLATEFPNTTLHIDVHTNAIFRTAEQRAALIKDMATVDNCTIITSNSQLIKHDIARLYPRTMFIALHSLWDGVDIPNLILLLSEQAQPFYFMGVAAAHQAKTAVGAIAAWAPPVTTGSAVHYFLAGVRSVNATIPAHVIVTGAWYNPSAEVTAAKELVELGCDVISRASDGFDADQHIARLAGDTAPTKFSFGVHIPLQHFVGDTALASSILQWTPMLLPYYRDVLTLGRLNGSHSEPPLNIVPSELGPWSIKTKPAALRAAKAAVAKWGCAAHVQLCDGPYTTLNGSVAPTFLVTKPGHPAYGKRCVNDYTAFDFIRFPNTLYHATKKFEDGATLCGTGTHYAYDRTPELKLRCVPCPRNTFRSVFQEKATKACTPCPAGTVSDVGATSCHPPPVAASTAVIPDFVVATIVFGSVLVVAGIGAAVSVLWWRRWSTPATRRLSNAPTSADTPFAIVFTDIQASTALWAHSPQMMGCAIDTHHALVRRCIAEHAGYEVKTIGDSFMVTFHEALSAVNFALAVQHALFREEWGTDRFDKAYQELLLEAGVVDDCDSRLWSGLRVRVSIHYGIGDIKYDETVKGYDYYGTLVNTAARVESVGHGGQVLLTDAAMAALMATGSPVAGAVVTDLGLQPLRGLEEPVRLHQLVPTSLAARQFPPLRLDHYETLMDGMSTESSHSDTMPVGGIMEDTPAEGVRDLSGSGAGAQRHQAYAEDSPPLGPMPQRPSLSQLYHEQDPIGRSVRTLSTRSPSIADNTDEFAAAARRLRILAGAGGPALCLCYRVVEAMLSTQSPAARRGAVTAWAKAWRVHPPAPWATRVGKAIGQRDCADSLCGTYHGELLLVLGRALNTVESLPMSQRPELLVTTTQQLHTLPGSPNDALAAVS